MPPILILNIIALYLVEGYGSGRRSKVVAEVHPKLYGDGRTRLYTRWTADVHQKTGCYNTICPGFVQIYKDQEYYLQLATMFAIGFWPDTLFKELRNGSETVRFGGKAYTAPHLSYASSHVWSGH
ncbi:hypothetical protein MTR67_019796 [Solanum verrucosum]|uniref:Neprosin PEP catalytic domain-containing protein n=1 Tax=Solanum verrucosum TaxID=315347 RepID=A0AAF0QTK1_SOLVR|nr:hypothetical protein MTR67_019796 [Solanum verrucosum]